MTKVVVEIAGQQPYNIRVAKGALGGLGLAVRECCKATRAMVVTDTAVAPRYLGAATKSLEAAGFNVSAVTVPAGESAKSVECATNVWNAMLNAGLSRSSVVVALGGGVVGDLAGFCASTFMRGLLVVQVPTTLLSMVDSSVGGKTAINLEGGKNLVGTFHQPLYVCADIDVLTSLPAREWACGCGEIAKSAVIESDEFFFWLTDSAAALAARDASVVEEAICRCVVFKAGVVARDVSETQGVRECLNYGHTLAHAIETLSGYGVYSHGQAVAQGMRFAARLSAALCGLSPEFVAAQDALLDALGLPALEFACEPERLLATMKADKKAQEGQVRFVLLRDVGAWEVQPVASEVLLEHLSAWQGSLA